MINMTDNRQKCAVELNSKLLKEDLRTGHFFFKKNKKILYN